MKLVAVVTAGTRCVCSKECHRASSSGANGEILKVHASIVGAALDELRGLALRSRLESMASPSGAPEFFA